VPATTVHSRRKVTKSSDEIYDDYQEHDPTMAPDTPTRTPRIQQPVQTTIGSRPQTTRVEAKVPQFDESVDANPSVVQKNEE
jgi:hypothetical protein